MRAMRHSRSLHRTSRLIGRKALTAEDSALLQLGRINLRCRTGERSVASKGRAHRSGSSEPVHPPPHSMRSVTHAAYFNPTYDHGLSRFILRSIEHRLHAAITYPFSVKHKGDQRREAEAVPIVAAWIRHSDTALSSVSRLLLTSEFLRSSTNLKSTDRYLDCTG